jgi:glycosyltransferase involved in cell wall biosynthesis
MNAYTDWLKGFNTRNLQILDHLQRFDEIEKILYIDFLPFTWKRAIRHYIQNILLGIKNRNTLFGDLTSRCTQVTSKITVYSTIDSIFSEKKVIYEIKKVLLRLGWSNFILWSNNPMFVSAFNELPAQLKIFDTIDNWLEHPSYHAYKNRLQDNYQLIAKKADLIFTVAEKLKDFYLKLGRQSNVHFITNGVDLERFLVQDLPLPNDMQKIKRPIITYIGSIQNRLDLEILAYLYQKNPEKSFLMIGPTWPVYFKSCRKKSPEVKLMEKYQNVHYLGRKPYSEIASYIQHSDIMIIPHREDEFLKYTSPTKLYQFLAAGKPVVSTRGAGVDYFAKLVHLASSKEEFQAKIQLALKEVGQQKLAEQRRQAVQNHSWSNRAGDMLAIIRQKMYN